MMACKYLLPTTTMLHSFPPPFPLTNHLLIFFPTVLFPLFRMDKEDVLWEGENNVPLPIVLLLSFRLISFLLSRDCPQKKINSLPFKTLYRDLHDTFFCVIGILNTTKM